MNNFRNNYARYNNNNNSGNQKNSSPTANGRSDTDQASDDSLKTMEENNEKQNDSQTSNDDTKGSAGKDSWKNDPSLKNMDLKKLAFLSELAAQSGNQSMDSLLPFLISANKNANSMGLQFNNSETDLILNVLKSRMSPEEQSRIEMLRKMADMLGRKS